MWYKNIAGRFFGLVTKHACDGQTDGRTDGQNYDSQDRPSIARAVQIAPCVKRVAAHNLLKRLTHFSPTVNSGSVFLGQPIVDYKRNEPELLRLSLSSAMRPNIEKNSVYIVCGSLHTQTTFYTD